MINRVFKYALLILMIFPGFSFAQQKVLFEHLSVPDGLSSNTINSICQDDNGFLWIATSDGLNRYDGYRFQVFKNDPADTLSLPSRNISIVYKDRNGTLWIGTTDGLPELKNPNGEMFDYPRVEQIFRDIADQPPQAIIDRLVNAGEVWRKDLLLEDDITLMVIKAR